MCQRKEKLLTKFHSSKKEKAPDKVLCANNIYNRKVRLLTICHASNTKFYKKVYIDIYNHEIQKNEIKYN